MRGVGCIQDFLVVVLWKDEVAVPVRGVGCIGMRDLMFNLGLAWLPSP